MLAQLGGQLVARGQRAIVEEHLEPRAVVDVRVQRVRQHRAQLVGELLAPLSQGGVVRLPLGVRVADEDVVIERLADKLNAPSPRISTDAALARGGVNRGG